MVFVDDRKNQAESVLEACERMHIPCLAFIFTKAAQIEPPFNEEAANNTLRTLLQEHKLP